MNDGGLRWKMPVRHANGVSVKIATFVYRKYLSSCGFAKMFWGGIRKRLVKLLGDPPCSMNIHGKSLDLPLSHALPAYLYELPFYDTLPGRLSDYLYRKYGVLKCVDVGANVGDSIAAFSRHETDMFLAIEPNPNYSRYLRQNFGDSQNVRILETICSSSSLTGNYEISELSGTASITRTEKGSQMLVKTLDSIILDYPEFSNLNMLKIDTDGHDFEVIDGAKKAILKNKPALFFECEAFSGGNYVENLLNTLKFLKEAGYSSFMMYDNHGYFIGFYSLEDLRPLKNLLFYQLTRTFYYFDLLVMKEEDLVSFLMTEQSFFSQHMTDESLRNAAATATLP